MTLGVWLVTRGEFIGHIHIVMKFCQEPFELSFFSSFSHIATSSKFQLVVLCIIFRWKQMMPISIKRQTYKVTWLLLQLYQSDFQNYSKLTYTCELHYILEWNEFRLTSSSWVFSFFPHCIWRIHLIMIHIFVYFINTISVHRLIWKTIVWTKFFHPFSEVNFFVVFIELY